MRSKRYIATRPRIAVVVDGETEFWYLQMLKRNEKDLPVHIKPEIPQRKALKDQYAKVTELAREYDKVFWIVDLDVILAESKVNQRNRPKAIDLFVRYKKAIENITNTVLIINQPCLEFWFLIHFEYTVQPFSACEEATKRLKKHLPDYIKSEKYFTKQDRDIYLRVKRNLPQAIRNSRKLPHFDSEVPEKGLSEMYKLFDYLLPDSAHRTFHLSDGSLSITDNPV